MSVLPQVPRVAGVTVPLFSLRTERSWGIGEIGDLPDLAAWLRPLGITLIQILPLGEMSSPDTSPYGALSAFGIDPLFISLSNVVDLPADKLRDALQGDVSLTYLQDARRAHRVDYEAVRFLKKRALRFAFDRFRTREHARGTQHAKSFESFAHHERHWLDDFALYRAIKDANDGVPWWEWERSLRERQSDALANARAQLTTEILYYKYLQWLAHSQWEDARAKLHELGVEIMGDLPFMVGRDSADVWANQREFRLDHRVGVPGDQFDPEGQDWGLPPYKWDAMRANDFAWLRRRARYAGSLYDRFRIDHLVGFYRTYMRTMQPRDEKGKLVEGFFDPAEQRAQLVHGERVIGAMLEASREKLAMLVAEDLGTVPPFVRPSLQRMRVPGYKVLIWEKDTVESREVFRNPAEYPVLSVGCLGTHDTDPASVWWRTLAKAERTAVLALPAFQPYLQALQTNDRAAEHAALLDVILQSSSELVLLLMQDVIGVTDRINKPGTVGPHNWSWRLPATISRCSTDPYVKAHLERVQSAISRAQRPGRLRAG